MSVNYFLSELKYIYSNVVKNNKLMRNILFSITFFKKFVAIYSYDMNRICLKYINSLHGKFYKLF